MKHLFILFTFFAFHFQAPAQQSGTPYITNFPPDVYKAENQNWTIIQDKRGIMYVGNNSGVLEYDGITWRLIKTPSAVRSLAIDGKGRIYVGIRGDFGYLEADSLGSYQFLSLKEKIPLQDRDFNDVWKIYVSDNQVFFQSYEKLFILQNDKFKVVYPKQSFHFSFLVNNTFYVLEKGKGLMSYQNDSLKLLGGERFVKDRISAMLPFGQDQILIATRQQGVWLYKPLQNTFSKPIGFEAIDNFLRQHPVYCSIVLQQGTFALGTLTGMIVFDAQGHIQAAYNTDAGLQDNSIFALYTDAQQQLWAGLGNGISRLQTQLPFQRFTEKNGLKGFPMSIDFFDNQLYVGTSQYVYVQKPDGNFETIPGTEGQNWQLYPINGMLLLANNNGLFEIKGNQAIPIIKSSGFLGLSPLNRQANYLLAGLQSGGLCVLEYAQGTWKIKNPIKGFSKTAYKIVQDKEGGIWVSTNSQLYGLALNQSLDSAISVRLCTTGQGLPTEKAHPYLLNSGEVVFGTEKGIYRYLPATHTFEPHPTFTMLKGDIFPFQEQKNGDIWFQEKTGTGVYEKGVLKYTKDKYQLFKQPFYKFNEEIMSNYYTFYVASDTAVFVGTIKSLLQYNPLQTVDYTNPYHTLIRTVFAKDSLLFGGATANANEFEHLKGAVIPYSQNNLMFHYAAAFYEDVEKNLYSYRLVGSDTTWSAWVSDVKKEYTNLWEGDYTFEVKSKNQYREIGKTASYSFRVLPPWYRTWWAYSLYIAFFLGLGFVVLKLYTRRLLAQKEHLEQLITERTAEVVQQKEEISATLEVVNQQKEGIVDSINYAKRIQTAILPFEERIGNSFGKDNFFILFKPKDIVSGDFYWFEEVHTITETIKFMVVADCTGHGVPGAFMSMIGSQLLHEIIIKNQIYSPDLILNQLHKEVHRVLRQKETNTNDGMDISILTIYQNLQDLTGLKIEYAGAINPLYYVQNGELKEIKASKRSIGGEQSEEERFFEKHEVINYELEITDYEKVNNDENNVIRNSPLVIYLCTDGYQDQFGGEGNRKFMVKKLRELLFGIAGKPMPEQVRMLDETFENWKGDYEQIDDVTIVGIRL